MLKQVPTAASTSSIGSTAASVPPSGAGSSVSIVNERAVVCARAPSSQVVTVLNDPRPTEGSPATASLVASKASRSSVVQLPAIVSRPCVDGSELGFAGPEGSGAIEAIFKGFFD